MSNYYVHTISSFIDLINNLELIIDDESKEDILNLLDLLILLGHDIQESVNFLEKLPVEEEI